MAGGAIYVTSGVYENGEMALGAKLTLELGSDIKGNKAEGYKYQYPGDSVERYYNSMGGAIYSRGSVLINHTKNIEDNTANNGGAVAITNLAISKLSSL